jgi:DNA-binding NarL/FixJ family response regulator
MGTSAHPASSHKIVEQTVRVVVFETTRMSSELLSRALESSNYGIKVVGMYTSSIAPPNSLDADVCVVSASLNDGLFAGFTVLKKLSKSNPQIQCIMLLDRDDKEMVIEAFRNGAVGVYEREQSYEFLCKCIRSVHSGQVWANSQQLRYVLQAFAAGISTRITNSQGQVLLTSREEQIVALVADGLKNREIAESLKVSRHTVKNHLFRVFEKLGISSRAELILYLLGRKSSEEAEGSDGSTAP